MDLRDSGGLVAWVTIQVSRKIREEPVLDILNHLSATIVVIQPLCLIELKVYKSF